MTRFGIEAVGARRPRGASARVAVLAAGTLAALVVAPPPSFPGETVVIPGASADIEVRKTFRPVSKAGSSPRAPTPAATDPSTPGRAPRTGVPAPGFPDASLPGKPGGPQSVRRLADAVATALGERFVSTGSLHLPGVGGAGLALDVSRTPIVEFASGRRVILDADGSIPASTAAEIERLWPGFSVVPRLDASTPRALVDALVDGAGYARVLRGSTLRFGRDTTVLFRPDSVVLRGEDDLLRGETRALSVLAPGAAPVPGELRELAREHRIAVVELDATGAPAGTDRAPWRDPAGRVTTVEGRSSLLLIAELAAALGFTVERDAPIALAAGIPPARAPLTVTSGGDRVCVFVAEPGPEVFEQIADAGALGIVVPGGADPSAAIGRLLERFGVRAIGPAVEFHPAGAPGDLPRFSIQVPGSLVEHAGRRLLVTGSRPPPLVRLYLAREGIDVFEYRLR